MLFRSQVAGLSYVAQILEQLTPTDSITYTYDSHANVTGILLTLSLTSPLVWGMINDNQSAGWVQITDGAAGTWTKVPN